MRIINTLRQHPGGVTLDRYTYQPRRYREGFAVSLTDCAFNDLTAANVTRSLSTIRRTARALHLKQYAVGYWADGGRHFLDLSLIVKTLSEALAIGRAFNQKAVFNFRTLQAVPVR